MGGGSDHYFLCNFQLLSTADMPNCVELTKEHFTQHVMHSIKNMFVKGGGGGQG